MVGCDCRVCTSTDPRDHRTRHGALLEADGGRLLIDTPPELRLQLLRAGIDRVDAVWYTHAHADHLHGIDDLRIFSLRGRGDLPAYISDDARPALLQRFDYIFDPEEIPLPGTSKPGIHLRSLHPYRPIELVGETFVPLPVPHGTFTPLGFRVGGLGYITDAKRLPSETSEVLQGVRVLVLNALWYGDPHPTHFNVEEALKVAEGIGAERTYLVHLTHRLSHRELLERLPPGVRPAHDGLTVTLEPTRIREETS